MRMPTGWQEGFHAIKPLAIPTWAVSLDQNNVDIDVSIWYLNQCQMVFKGATWWTTQGKKLKPRWWLGWASQSERFAHDQYSIFLVMAYWIVKSQSPGEEIGDRVSEKLVLEMELVITQLSKNCQWKVSVDHCLVCSPTHGCPFLR